VLFCQDCERIGSVLIAHGQVANGWVQIVNASVQIANGSVRIVNGSVQMRTDQSRLPAEAAPPQICGVVYFFVG
jgi:hypothetical protein